jgi:hypothetical protein
MTVPFLPPNLMKLVRPTLSCVKNSWPLNCLIQKARVPQYLRTYKNVWDHVEHWNLWLL